MVGRQAFFVLFFTCFFFCFFFTLCSFLFCFFFLFFFFFWGGGSVFCGRVLFLYQFSSLSSLFYQYINIIFSLCSSDGYKRINIDLIMAMISLNFILFLFSIIFMQSLILRHWKFILPKLFAHIYLSMYVQVPLFSCNDQNYSRFAGNTFLTDMTKHIL